MPNTNPIAQPIADDSGVNALLGQLARNMEQARADKTKAAARRDRLLDELGQIKAPAPPRLMSVQTAPPKPPESDPFRAFTGFAPLLATIGSLFTRKPLISALNSLAGANQAFAQGQHEAYIQNVESFKAQSKAALDNNKALLDQYRAIINNRNLTANEKIAEIHASASEVSDQAMLEQSNLRSITSLISARMNSGERMKLARLRLETEFQLRANSPNFIRSQIFNEAVRDFEQKNKRQPTPQEQSKLFSMTDPAQLRKQTDFNQKVAVYDDINSQIDKILKIITDEPKVIGLVGKAAKAGQKISDLTKTLTGLDLSSALSRLGFSENTMDEAALQRLASKATEFETRVLALQSELARPIVQARYFTGPIAGRLSQLVQGLNLLDSPTTTKANLNTLKQIVADQRAFEESSGTPDTSVKTDDLSGMSNEDLINLGKTLGVEGLQ